MTFSHTMTWPIKLDEIDWPPYTLIFILTKSNNKSNNMVILRYRNHLSRFVWFLPNYHLLQNVFLLCLFSFPHSRWSVLIICSPTEPKGTQLEHVISLLGLFWNRFVRSGVVMSGVYGKNAPLTLSFGPHWNKTLFGICVCKVTFKHLLLTFEK